MLRRVRWLLIGVGLLTLAGGGASLFAVPDYEVLYHANPPLPTCTTSFCLAIYTLEVGNTGSRQQSQVRIRLRSAPLSAAIMPPTVRNFGKVDRPVAVTDAEDVRTFALGSMRPGERVELTLVLRYKLGEESPSWNQVLAGVDAGQGKALSGDPAAITLGRIFVTLFGGRW
jgi:hypothetical protein